MEGVPVLDMHVLLALLQELLPVYGLKLLAALAVFVIGRWVAGMVTKLLERFMTRADVDATIIPFVRDLAYVGMLAMVIIAALGALGVQTASLIAILGAAGLAVGLALQGSLSNFAAGVLILILRPIRVGDYFEGAGVAGVVEQIQMFFTTAKTPDNKVIIIPNSKLLSDNIINYSMKNIRRVDFIIGVGYNDSLDKVKEILNDIVVNHPRTLKEPAPAIGLIELADSSVNFAVRPWVKTADYWPAHFEILETIKKRFDAEGISIPFPQRDVHLYKETGE